MQIFYRYTFFTVHETGVDYDDYEIGSYSKLVPAYLFHFFAWNWSYLTEEKFVLHTYSIFLISAIIIFKN